MSAPIRISVVIPTYERCACVHRLLCALASQSFPADEYEVIVSVDGSDDGTLHMVSQFPAPYRLLGMWHPNHGRAAACNAGIRAATGELIVLLDDDMEPVPEFLEAHSRAHRCDTRSGIMGAVPISFDRSSPPVVQYIGTKFNRHLENLAHPDHRLKLTDFYSGNFSIPRQVMVEVGCFDESFKIYGNEDLELWLRLARAGVQFGYSAEALALQHYTKDFAALARDNIAKGRTAVLLASKHPEALRLLKLSTYDQVSLKWRLLRGTILGLSRLWMGTPDAVIGIWQWVEHHRLMCLRPHYYWALDYFYWLGAKAALQENRKANIGLTSLATSSRESQM